MKERDNEAFYFGEIIPKISILIGNMTSNFQTTPYITPPFLIGERD